MQVPYNVAFKNKTSEDVSLLVVDSIVDVIFFIDIGKCWQCLCLTMPRDALHYEFCDTSPSFNWHTGTQSAKTCSIAPSTIFRSDSGTASVIFILPPEMNCVHCAECLRAMYQ